MAKRTQKSAPKKPAKSATKRPPRPSSSPVPRGRRSARPHGDHDIEIIARGLWLHGSQALMCQNLDKGYLYLPGGHVEFGESATAALEREFLEEAGIKVAAGPLQLVSEAAFETKKRWHHEVNLVFLISPPIEATRKGGRGGRGDASPSAADLDEPPAVRSREKRIGFEWVDLAAAVDLDIRPLAVKAWLAAGAGVDPAAARAEWISEMPR